MKKILIILPFCLAAFVLPAHADNIAACEVVLMEPVLKDGIDTGAKMASFRPAVAFMSSVYDDEDGVLKTLDGYDIRGVMCERRYVIPTLRDFPILATGLPLAMSENFDSPDSRLMTTFYKDSEFQYTYQGPPLSPSEEAKLKDVIDIFNLQPHGLSVGEAVDDTNTVLADQATAENQKDVK